jgi:heme exporter protein A
MMSLVADDVTKRFGPYTAIDSVSLSIDGGDRVSVLGPNGSGKTTLLRMLAGVSTPTAGTVRIDGEDLYSRGSQAGRAIGYLSHQSMLYDDLSARENLQFHAQLVGVDRERVEEVLEIVDLRDRAGGFPREFSHGMQKRLSFARALLDDPDVLLLDEPFTGLDQHSTRTLQDTLEDRAIVLVTHEPEMSAALCDRFLILDDGDLVARLPGEEVESAETLRERYQEGVR